jgi:hypothetical protein
MLPSLSLQARAAATAGTASEVTGIAQLAQREVAMLQAQLVDLDKRNKLAVRTLFMPLACHQHAGSLGGAFQLKDPVISKHAV